MSTSEIFPFGELLQQLRKRRRLNQKQLAERIGVSRETISLWERGEYKPETDTVLYELVRILDLSEPEQQQLFEAYTITALATSFHNPPQKRNPYFTGRSSQLNKLHTLLMAGKQVALTQAITGLGGIGKTQLALEYAYRYQKSYHDIFWVNAATEESLMASYVLLAGLLHLPENEEPDQNKVREAVQRWFRKHTGWLLILDNVEDLNLLQQFVPIDRQGAVLLTTRRQVTEPVAQALELELLPENDAILFLLKRTKILAIDKSLKNASDHQIEAARAITHLLGDLPLALDQAGAYILETACSFSDYLALFKTYQAQLLQRRIGEGIPTDHPEAITTTFRLNFEQVQRRSNAAAEILRFCVFLAPDSIPEEILTAGASLLGPVLAPVVADAYLLNEAIEALRAYSLITRDSQSQALSIHRLVQAVLRDSMMIETQQQWRQRTIQAVNATFPRIKFQNWSICERLLPHALVCATGIEQLLDLPESRRLLNQAGSYLYSRARYKESESLLRQALAICEQQLGTQHPETATSLNNLAELYLVQGKFEEAEPLFRRAISTQASQLGVEHPNMLISFNNLASLYCMQGKYAEAEPLLQWVFFIQEQRLGAEHPNLATSLNNLAELYRMQGKYTEAEPLFRRALSIQEQRLGVEHPDTATSLNNLALLYEAQGKYAEAELLYQRALAICEQQLGAEHPNLATSLNNLAELYRMQGKYTEAELLFRRALSIRALQLGTEHPSTITSLNNMALLYNAQGKYPEAESLFRRVLSIREQQLGAQHPETATSLNNLAELYRMQGKYTEAEPLFRRALSIQEQRLGVEHPDIARSLDNLGGLCGDQGKYAEAELLCQRALSIYEQHLGAKHPETATSLANLANLYYAQAKYTEAEPLLKRALAISEQQLGATHPQMANHLNNLALLYQVEGKYVEAEPLLERAVAISGQQLGTEHPQTQQLMKNYLTFLAEVHTGGDIKALLQLLAQREPDNDKDEETTGNALL